MNELRVLLDLVLVHRFDRRHDDDTRDLVIEVRHLRILIARHKVEASLSSWAISSADAAPWLNSSMISSMAAVSSLVDQMPVMPQIV